MSPSIVLTLGSSKLAMTSLIIGTPFLSYSFVGNSIESLILNVAFILEGSVDDYYPEAERDYLLNVEKKFCKLPTLLVFLRP
jgi:hypothetical protein